MATITFTVTAGPQSLSASKTISGADLQRVITLYRAIMNMPDATDAEIMTVWINSLFQDMRRTVVGLERSRAVGSASAAVADLDLS